MSAFVILGGPGALIGLAVGFLTRPRFLFIPLVAGLGIVMAAGVYGTTTSGETDGAWLAGIIASAQYLGLLVGTCVGAGLRGLRQHHHRAAIR